MTIQNAGNSADKLDLSYTVHENVNGITILENSWTVSDKTKHMLSNDPVTAHTKTSQRFYLL